MITAVLAVIFALIAGVLFARAYIATLDLCAKRADLHNITHADALSVIKGTGYLLVRTLRDEKTRLYRIVNIPDRTTLTVRKACWLERLAFLPRRKERH